MQTFLAEKYIFIHLERRGEEKKHFVGAQTPLEVFFINSQKVGES